MRPDCLVLTLAAVRSLGSSVRGLQRHGTLPLGTVATLADGWLIVTLVGGAQ